VSDEACEDQWGVRSIDVCTHTARSTSDNRCGKFLVNISVILVLIVNNYVSSQMMSLFKRCGIRLHTGENVAFSYCA